MEDSTLSYEYFENLLIGIGELSAITDIPIRQIRYWEERGMIESNREEGRNKKFNFENLLKIVFIKELLDEGYTLEHSFHKIESRRTKIEIALDKLRQLRA